MQGGLTRYAKAADEMVVNSSQGGGCKDTWVLDRLRTGMKRRSLASLEHRPLIGVTTSEVRPKERTQPIPEGDPSGKEMALGITYLKGIEAAGGLPLVMPPMDERRSSRCSTGSTGSALRRPRPRPGALRGGAASRAGSDRARPRPLRARRRRPRRRPRDADPGDLPRHPGAEHRRGGAVHQHLPDLSNEVTHRQTNPGTEPSHPVEVDPDSRLAEVFGGGELEVADVNSFHHQAIDRLGEGLRVSARAPDGTVEAIEDPDSRFLIGVQWHAETLVHREAEAALFRRFVEACRDDGAEYERAAARREVA